MDFLPVNMDEAKARGWEQLDFVIVILIQQALNIKSENP